MAENVMVRLEVPYEKIKSGISFDIEDVFEFYDGRVKTEVENLKHYFLKGKLCNEELMYNRYAEACSILATVSLYKQRCFGLYKKLSFSDLAKVVNAYFLKNSRATYENNEDFDFQKSFITFLNNQ